MSQEDLVETRLRIGRWLPSHETTIHRGETPGALTGPGPDGSADVEPVVRPLLMTDVGNAPSGGSSRSRWTLVAMAVSLAAMLLVGAAVDQWTDSAPNTRRGTDPDTRAGATAGPGTSSAPAGAVLPPPDLVGHVAESWRGTAGTGNDETGAAHPQMTVGARIGLEPVGRPGFRVRHRNFVGRTDLIGPASSQFDRADSSFTVRKGLADPRCFSLEAVNFPGFFLRHQNFGIYLHRFDRSPLYAQDATFCVVTGLAGQQVSFRSVNYPDRYLSYRDDRSHRDDRLRLDPLDGSSATRLAMTFAVRPALLPA